VHFRRKKTRPVRAGVVGVGQMGRYHVGVLAEIPQVELVGIVDIDPKRIQFLAETYNTAGLRIIAISSARSMWSVSRCPQHCIPRSPVNSLTLACMCSSRNQFAPTLAEAEELFELAEQRGVMLHVGHVERFNGAVQELKNIVRDPILIECRRLGPFQSRAKDDGLCST